MKPLNKYFYGTIALSIFLILLATFIISDTYVSNTDTLVFDRQWYEEDKEYFYSLYNQLNFATNAYEVLFNEYKDLLGKKEKVYDNAYMSKKGYLIFSPELTDNINALALAIEARAKLLYDVVSNNKILPKESYYPEEFQYTFFKAENVIMLNDSDDNLIEIKDDFDSYDFKAINDFIESLSIPEYCLRGKNIFFVNAKNRDFGAIHANGQIIIYNWDNNIDSLIKFLAHELGHEVGYSIFGRDYYLNECIETKLAYANIYGKKLIPDHFLPWEERLSENFAEDFALIYAGSQKWTSWEGDNSLYVKEFIEDSIHQTQIEDLIILRDTIHVKAGKDTTTFFGGFNDGNIFITEKDEIEINIKDIKGGPYTLYAYIKDDVVGNLGRIPIEDNKFVIPLGENLQEDARCITYEIDFKLYYFESLTKYHSSPFGRVKILYSKDL